MSGDHWHLFILGYIRYIPPVFEVWWDRNKHGSSNVPMTLGRPVLGTCCYTGKNAACGSLNALAEMPALFNVVNFGDIENATTTRRCAGSEQSFVDFRITFAVAGTNTMSIPTKFNGRPLSGSQADTFTLQTTM